MFQRKSLKVACVVAHPDDEVLACGASLARHARQGHLVSVLILAAGLDARGAASVEAHARHKAAAAEAARRLGLPEPQHAGFPDNRLDTVAMLDVIQTVEKFFENVRPDVVYTHHRGDLNIDHRIAHDAVLTAARPMPGSTLRRIIAGETLSSTEWQPPTAEPFVPTLFHDVSGQIEAKIAALEAYASEIRAFPHPRSAEAVRALAAYRGAQSGFAAAEAFMLVRERA